jgi:ankyrin repeat protein
MVGKLLALGLALSAMALGVTLATPEKRTSEQAVRKALPLMQRSAKVWFQQTKCGSCHHQSLNMAAVALAAERGIKVDQAKRAEQIDKLSERGELSRFEQYEGTGAINGSAGFSFLLFAMAAENQPKTEWTDSTVYYLLGKQAADGRWPSFSFRPPIEAYPSTLTAMAIRGIRLYAPNYLRDEAQLAIERGRTWLLALDPKNNEDAAFKVLGLHWSGALRTQVDAARKQLLHRQRSDGGWSQLPTMDSDAYATGQALVALNVAGVDTRDSSFRRGIEFLLRTQRSDGSWLVKTRRRIFPGLPYFETGFPHREHQFISFAGSSWAAMALTIDSRPGTNLPFTRTSVPERSGTPAAYAMNARDNRLFEAAMEGSVEDVRKAIAAGANVNGLSKSNATPLLYAVRDPRKVELLLAKGANPNFVSKTKSTALLLAAENPWTRKSFDLLLAAGANPHKARSDFDFPLGVAVSTRSTSIAQTLIKSGATEKERQTAAMIAVFVGDTKMLDFMLANGVDPNFKFGKNEESLLFFAVADGKSDLVKLLLDRGANAAHVCRDGISTLIAAALFDPGSTEIIEMLLAKGANPSHSFDGKSALSLAKKYGNDEIAKVLESAGQDRE